MIPVMTNGREQELSIEEFFDDLNYTSYAAQRDREMSAERAQVFYVRYGGFTLEEVQRWEQRYQSEPIREKP